MNNLVFVDESGVNIAITRLYARAFIGKRAHASRPAQREKNVTMISALSLKGMIAAMTFKGGNDQTDKRYISSHCAVFSLTKI